MNQTLMHMLHNGKYAKFRKYATYVKCKFGVLLFSHRNLIKQEICSLLFLKGICLLVFSTCFRVTGVPCFPDFGIFAVQYRHTHTHAQSLAHRHTNALTYIHTECSKCSILVPAPQAHSRDSVSHN